MWSKSIKNVFMLTAALEKKLIWYDEELLKIKEDFISGIYLQNSREFKQKIEIFITTMMEDIINSSYLKLGAGASYYTTPLKHFDESLKTISYLINQIYDKVGN